MEINIELTLISSIVLVALVVEMTGSFTMCFTHEVVLTLTTETKSFGSAGVTSVPSLRGAADG
jgi:hypothetical protein